MFHLYIVIWLHYLIEIFYTTYIFIFPKKFDIYFSLFIFIICLHWIIFKNECILSYIEKKIIDPNYILGSTPNNHIHINLLHPFIYFLFSIIIFINILYVLYRNNSMSIRFLLLTSISIFLYYQFIFCDISESSDSVSSESSR
jgi:hypothetical protein